MPGVVDAWAEELLDKIAISALLWVWNGTLVSDSVLPTSESRLGSFTHDFHAIESGFDRTFRRMDVIGDCVVDVLQCHFLWLFAWHRSDRRKALAPVCYLD